MSKKREGDFQEASSGLPSETQILKGKAREAWLAAGGDQAAFEGAWPELQQELEEQLTGRAGDGDQSPEVYRPSF